jgi:Protein of unknown function (DUF1822)
MMLSHTQLEFDIAPEVLEAAWQQSRVYSNSRSQWTAFLNQICLSIVLPWLQAEHLPQAVSDLQAWELVNGTAIQSDRQRFIFIPDKSIDTSQLTVPQEWMDIPSWAGNYYFAVQINPDEQQLRIWAYTTHEQLKNQGSYDPSDRTYNLEAPSLVSDLNVLWVVRQLNPHEVTQSPLSPLTPVPAAQADHLLQRLTSAPLPRLEIPFSLWGSLLTADSWRDRLTQARQTGEVAPRRLTQISQWLQNSVMEGWQLLESLVNPDELATSLRQTPVSEVSREAVRRVKRLTIRQQTLLLIVAIAPEPDEKVNIRIQLRTEERTEDLPENLLLSLQSTAGSMIQSMQTGDRYSSIQLRPFKCRIGTQFKVQLEEQSSNLLEDDETQSEVLIEEWFQC